MPVVSLAAAVDDAVAAGVAARMGRILHTVRVMVEKGLSVNAVMAFLQEAQGREAEGDDRAEAGGRGEAAAPRAVLPNWELMAVVLVIVSGLALLVRGETKFDMLGFGLVMTASCLSGLRFTLTQVLLHGHQSSAALGGPLEVLELLTPVMSVTVMIFSLAWEELWLVLPGSPYFETAERTLLTSLVIAAGALIAFLMVWAEYQLSYLTSLTCTRSP
eukprot:XP_001690434.1 predicted protein [Chlamydomonas reinhardtii]